MNDYDNINNEKFILDILTKISENQTFMKLEDLADVEILKDLILEIEPKIEETLNLGKITLSKDDTPSGHYLNMSTIIKHLHKFISYSILHDSKKTYFPETTNIEKRIKINDLIKRNTEQLEILGEFLLFLIAISSKINTWIDKIDEMDSETITKYELFLEKFFYLSDNETPCPRETRYTSNFRKSIQNFGMDEYSSELFSKRSSGAGVPANSDSEREKFQRLVNEAEKEKNIYMERLNDAQREIEILKETNKLNLSKIEDLMTEILKASEYKRLFELKEQEYAEMKKSKDSQIKSLKDDKDKLLENLENTKDRVAQLSFVQSENEKLKNKLKEFSIFKDKNAENTTLLTTIESKDRIIDALSKENSTLLCKLEKCEEDFSAEKKKNISLSKDYENLVTNFNALNEDFIRIKKFLDRKSIKIEDDQGIVLDELYSNEANNNNKNYTANKEGGINGRRSQFRKIQRPVGNTGEGNGLLAEIDSEEENETNKGIDRNIRNSERKPRESRSKLEGIANAENERFSFEESEDEGKNEGIALNSVIGDRISVLKDNFSRFKKDTNFSNNFMSMGSFNMLTRKTNWESNELSIKSSNFDIISNKKSNQGNFNNFYVRRRIPQNNAFENEKQYLDTKLDSEERLKLSLIEIEKVKSEFDDYKAKSKVEFELISSSLFEIAHQFMDMKTKNENSNDKTKTKNWLQSERNKIFPLDK